MSRARLLQSSLQAHERRRRRLKASLQSCLSHGSRYPVSEGAHPHDGVQWERLGAGATCQPWGSVSLPSLPQEFSSSISPAALGR